MSEFSLMLEKGYFLSFGFWLFCKRGAKVYNRIYATFSTVIGIAVNFWTSFQSTPSKLRTAKNMLLNKRKKTLLEHIYMNMYWRLKWLFLENSVVVSDRSGLKSSSDLNFRQKRCRERRGGRPLNMFKATKFRATVCWGSPQPPFIRVSGWSNTCTIYEGCHGLYMLWTSCRHTSY